MDKFSPRPDDEETPPVGTEPTPPTIQPNAVRPPPAEPPVVNPADINLSGICTSFIETEHKSKDKAKHSTLKRKIHQMESRFNKKAHKHHKRHHLTK